MAEQIPHAQGPLIGQGRTAEIYAWGADQVLKLYRTGWPASSAESEARISQAVSAAGLPVPAVRGVIEVDGRHGILFDRVAGPSLLQQFGAKPCTLVRAVRLFTDLHLTMHRREISDLPSQRQQLVSLIEG